MIINYYAPGTSPLFRMWAAEELTKEFPDAALVAVHNCPPNERCYVWIEGVVEAKRFNKIRRFARELRLRYIMRSSLAESS